VAVPQRIFAPTSPMPPLRSANRRFLRAKSSRAAWLPPGWAGAAQAAWSVVSLVT
jgi:hypothetical protein